MLVCLTHLASRELHGTSWNAGFEKNTILLTTLWKPIISDSCTTFVVGGVYINLHIYTLQYIRIMELAIPLIALGGLYMSSKKDNRERYP